MWRQRITKVTIYQLCYLVLRFRPVRMIWLQSMDHVQRHASLVSISRKASVQMTVEKAIMSLIANVYKLIPMLLVMKNPALNALKIISVSMIHRKLLIV